MLKERKNVRNTEIEDAKEFAALYSKLDPNEKMQVKSIIIGIQIAKDNKPEVAAVRGEGSDHPLRWIPGAVHKGLHQGSKEKG